MRAILLVTAILTASCGGGDGSSGEFECTGDDCVCPGTGDCTVHCLDDCDLQCAGSGACELICDDVCLASCTGSGECYVTVGDDSTVDCPGSGGCDVVCEADCDVQCPGSGECIVQCEPGFACDIHECSGSVQSCDDDVLVCNGACPEA